MDNIYEGYSLEELEKELSQVKGICCVTDAQDDRKAAREIRLEKEIKRKQSEMMTDTHTYIAEMSLTITLKGHNSCNLLNVLKDEILSNPNIVMESLIISKQ